MGIIPLGLLVQQTVVAADKPRDLFADAAAEAEAVAENSEADEADSADAAATDGKGGYVCRESRSADASIP